MPLYSSFLKNQLDGTFVVDWDTDTLKCALFATAASSFVTISTGYSLWSQIGSGEITGTGYTASGQVTSGCAIAFNGHNPTRIKLSASNNAWPSSTLTAQYAVIYKWTGTASTSPLIAWVDFGSAQSSSSGTFEIQWNSSGIVEIITPN